MYCKICGAPLAQGDVFCKNCGASNTNADLNSEPETTLESPIEPDIKTDSEIIVEESPSEEVLNVEENSKEEAYKDHFYTAVGIFIGLISIAVIGFLVYNALNKKNNDDNSNVTILPNDSYNVIYAEHKFVFNSDMEVVVTDHLSMSNDKWSANVGYVDDPSYKELTIEKIKKYFEAITPYSIVEFVPKSYSGVSCYESGINYLDGTKTTLVICDRETGYWYAEIGEETYIAYPKSSIVSEVVTILANSKLVSKEESQFKIDKLEIPSE